MTPQEGHDLTVCFPENVCLDSDKKLRCRKFLFLDKPSFQKNPDIHWKPHCDMDQARPLRKKYE